MAEVVGGALLSSVFDALLKRLGSREVMLFFKIRKLNDHLLKKLKITMISVGGLLEDAEETQISSRAVMQWLDELKDAAYQADDLLDEIGYDSLRLELESGGQLRNFISSLNPYNREKTDINAKLHEIHDILEHLLQQKGILGLVEKNVVDLPSTNRLATTSLVDESIVYGRNDERETLVQLVLSQDGSGRCLDVIPIVGMGGIGKTTLAQLVYNDDKVKRSFHLTAWVCVSETFNVHKLTEDILKGVSETSYGNMTLDFLHCQLEEILKQKKVLLVLDDVWSDSLTLWDFLLKPFKSVAEGSKILVTTRDERVASVKSTTSSFRLKKLKDDDCWLLFEKHAFGDESSHGYANLEGIGRDIVEKCDGLPLAIKTLGSLLRSKRDVKEWEKVLKSSIWEVANDKILPALRLSYHYLPSHLKQCFAYCAVFPKDCKIYQYELVRLWMAEGLLVRNTEHEEMEEVGEQCIQDLVSRSFLQKSRDFPRFLTMHDLINDLAMLVSREFCVRFEAGDRSRMATNRTRYLTFDGVGNDISSVLEDQTRKAEFLRTFSSITADSVSIGKELHDLLLPVDYLRVLHLPFCINLSKFPDSITKLKHLRYLNLSGTRIPTLPKLICTLYYLQTLILCRCTSLVKLPNLLGNLKHLRFLDLYRTSIQRLPTTMGRLINLRYLDIRGTYIYLQEMPPQMSKLTKLLILRDFFIAKQSSSIEELGPLENLQELCIQNLDNVLHVSHATKANLKGKSHLEKLTLRWGDDSDGTLPEQDRDILKHLEPSTSLKDLAIHGYKSSKFPDWVGHPSFSNLATLTLIGCRYCIHLPQLGQLTSLKVLAIKDFGSLEMVGPEFYGKSNTSKKPFASLHKLVFSRMPLLRELLPPADDNDGGAFPLLEELFMVDCPNLRKLLPDYHLPSLRKLECFFDLQTLVAPIPRAPTIRYMTFDLIVKLTKLSSGQYHVEVKNFASALDSLLKELKQVGCSDSSLEKIDIAGWHELTCFPLELFQNLWSLYLWHCPNLESFSEHDRPINASMSLHSLSIVKCPKLVSFPEGGLHVPNLNKLELRDCSNLKLLPDCMNSSLPSLMELEISECPEIEQFPEEGLPSSLKTLVINGCHKLITGRMQWDLQALPSLTSFCIGNSEDVESFPEEKLLPSSLTSLTITGLPNLISLDYRGLQHLSFLTELKILYCEKLQSLPEEGLPPPLQILDIFYSPLLEKRCQEDTGEDWSKISQIPKLWIGVNRLY